VDDLAALTVSAGNPVVSCSGEIDLATADALASALDPWVGAGGPVILDYSEVSFMDSTGLRVLISAAKRLGDGGCIILHGVHGAVSAVLRMTGIEGAMENVHVIECDVIAPA
jgi:anti-sigma B factor antagonist